MASSNLTGRTVVLAIFVLAAWTGAPAIAGPLSAFDIVSCEQASGERSAIARRLVFFQSNRGFVIDSNTGAPFHEAVPSTIGSSVPSSSVLHVLVQKVPTQPMPTRWLNRWNGIPTWAPQVKWGLGILGLVIGGVVVPPIWKRIDAKNVPAPWLSGFVGLMAGVVAGALLAEQLYRGDFDLYVDNATADAVEVHVDQYPAIRLEARRHIHVIMDEGRYNVVIRATADGSEIERVTMDATLLRTREGRRASGKHVLNIAGANSYHVKTVAYTP